MAILDLANPTRFMSLTDRLLPWLWGATALVLGAGLYLGLFVAPADNLQGETYRIIFIHVPAAWLSMFGYGMMAISALGTLIWRHPLADVAAKATAPVGAAFTLMALITGSLWGKPMWGTWWEWDARMTSVLILFLMYLGLIALWNAIEDPIKGGRVAAVLILVGSVNLPIIKFSVDWWNTLHQPASVFRMGGSTIDSEHALSVAHLGHRRDAAVPFPKLDGDAQRDPAPPYPGAAPRRGCDPCGSFGMIEALGPHAGFILAAYAASALIVLAVLGWILVDGVSLRRQMRDLEARGIRRRSARKAADVKAAS
jgi:heme exporter protein C